MAAPHPVPALRMSDGRAIPQVGIGTWPLKDREVAPVVRAAVEAGYRHIDTAFRYGNERGVGQGIRDSGARREDLFVTTKLDGEFQGGGRARAGLAGCLERLGLGYVDLLLIHWPLPRRGEFISTWKTFEELVDAGLARSIGVSNFKPAHLDALLAEARTPPAVNQIQISPLITRAEQRAYDAARGIVTVSWGPLAPGTDLLKAPALAEIGAKHGKTPAQVVLRWHIELGLVAIPKSATPERIAQNIDIFDFALDSGDMAAIAALDRGEPGVDSDVSGH